MAHAVDLLVDRGFLLDIGVGARDVGLGLVIVVVGDEILDRVVGKEALELAVELRGQRLVGRENQRRALRRLDHLGHGEGLARAGDAEQHLIALVAPHPLDQLRDRLRLVALGLEFRDHPQPPPALRLFRPGRPVRRPRRPLANVGVALFEQDLERIDGRRRAGHAARVAVRRRALELRLRRFAEPLRPRLDQGGVQQRRQMLVERLQLGAGGFGAGRAAGLAGRGHGANMGRIPGRGKGGSRRFARPRPGAALGRDSSPFNGLRRHSGPTAGWRAFTPEPVRAESARSILDNFAPELP